MEHNEPRSVMSFIRAYLRASTKDQDANRALESLRSFTEERGQKVAATYAENVSGASLKRPELFRLLSDCREGDILLIEQVDRLSRLNEPDWDKLKDEIKKRRVRIVALDLPTSWGALDPHNDDIQGRMLDAINAMMLDMLAAIARKDYEDRKRRQEQGIAKAKAEGVYKGRPEDTERNDAIIKMLKAKQSWSSIISATRCSRSTLSRLSKRLPAKT
jgi:DNA invertase Pin-like site-specific DNA recombinase